MHIKIIITGALWTLSVFSVKAQDEMGSTFRLASVLQNNMVVQQNKPYKVWGYASSGDTVAIIADWMATPIEVVADSAGHFMGIIPVPVAQKGDYRQHELSVTNKRQSIVLTNLLIGDIWLCSGQSNMQFAMKETIDAAKEIPAADFPNIRLFSGGLNFSNEPIDSIKGSWKACSPATVRDFSAVAYHFGRELHQELDIPIGIIFTGIGASSAQAYVPENVLAEDPQLDSIYLQPYLKSSKSKEKIDGGFVFGARCSFIIGCR